MDDLTIFEREDILDIINPEYILVAYNFSVDGRVNRPFENFHGKNGEVYKLRYALTGTPLWGAYMTDVIKDFIEPKAQNVKQFLDQNKHVKDANIESFCKEIEELNVNDPTLFALGNDVFDILNEYLDKKFRIIKLTHYAWQNSKENYRTRIMSELKNNNFIRY